MEICRVEDVSVLQLATIITENVRFSDAVPVGTELKMKEIYTRLVETGKIFGSENVKALQILLELADFFFSLEFYKLSEDLIRRALHGFRRTNGLGHYTVFEVISKLGDSLRQQSKFEDAELQYRTALVVLTENYGDNRIEIMSTVDGLAATLHHLGKLDESGNFYQKLLEFNSTILGEEHPETLRAVNNLANVHKDNGKLQDAERLCVNSLEACTRVLGQEHPTTQVAVVTLAQLKQAQGKVGDAEEMYKRAHAYNVKTLGHDHVDTLSVLCLIARLQSEQKLYAVAEVTYRTALEGYKRAMGGNQPPTIDTMHNIGAMLLLQLKSLDAIAMLQDTYDLKCKYQGSESLGALQTYFLLGKSYHQESTWRQKKDSDANWRLAEDILMATMRTADKVLDAESAFVIEVIVFLIPFLLEREKAFTAEPYSRRLYAYYRKRFGLTSIYTIEAAYRLATILALQYEYQQASGFFEIAHKGYQEVELDLAILPSLLGATWNKVILEDTKFDEKNIRKRVGSMVMPIEFYRDKLVKDALTQYQHSVRRGKL